MDNKTVPKYVDNKTVPKYIDNKIVPKYVDNRAVPDYMSKMDKRNNQIVSSNIYIMLDLEI